MAPDAEALEKAIHVAECSADFTDEEIRALKAIADAWKGLEAFGRVAGVVKKILTYVGWMIATYLAFKAGLVDFIKNAVVSK